MRLIAHTWYYEYSESFVLAVLHALEADTRPPSDEVIFSVEHLAGRHTHSAEQRRIQEAAGTCLTALTARWNLAHADQVLMRGSTPPEAVPDTLVRPVHAELETDPNELLRIGDQP